MGAGREFSLLQDTTLSFYQVSSWTTNGAKGEGIQLKHICGLSLKSPCCIVLEVIWTSLFFLAIFLFWGTAVHLLLFSSNPESAGRKLSAALSWLGREGPWLERILTILSGSSCAPLPSLLLQWTLEEQSRVYWLTVPVLFCEQTENPTDQPSCDCSLLSLPAVSHQTCSLGVRMYVFFFTNQMLF